MLNERVDIAPTFFRRTLRGIALVMAAVAPMVARAEAPEAVPVDGDPFPARLVAIDPQWNVTFDASGDRTTLPAAELVAWGRWEEVGRGPVLVFADGGLLTGVIEKADKERLAADSDLFGPVELPLERLAGVVFRLPADRHARDLLLDRVASAAGDSDRLILTNGDEVTGRLEAIADRKIRLAAVVGSVDVEVEADRVRAMIFNPALVARPEREGVHAIAGFRGGNRLAADRLVTSGSKLEIEIGDGLRWKGLADDLVSLQPLGGRVTYLSDLEAADYRHVPYLDLSWPYRLDRNVSGGMLRAGGNLYLKGLGMHSAARLTYRLTDPYRRFQALLAIDDGTSGGGSVRYRVFVDGELEYTSPTVRGGRAPVPASVDLAGAERLDLVVDFADRADVQDRANWLGARLVR